MVESGKVIEKLTAEGLDTSFANGITFEDEEKLDSWVSTAKTAFGNKPKGLDEYTKEEFKELADKGNIKALQSLLDETRTKTLANAKPKTEPASTAKNEEVEALKASFDALKAELDSQKTVTQEAAFNQMVKEQMKGFDELEVEMVKALLPKTATQAEVKAKVDAYVAIQVKNGASNVRTGQANKAKDGELPTEYINAFQALKPKQ